MVTLAHFACVLHWFNPTVWWLRRTFLSQCEYACDAHLVKKGTDPRVYTNALCDVAQSASAHPLSLCPQALRSAILKSDRRGRTSLQRRSLPAGLEKICRRSKILSSPIKKSALKIPSINGKFTQSKLPRHFLQLIRTNLPFPDDIVLVLKYYPSGCNQI